MTFMKDPLEIRKEKIKNWLKNSYNFLFLLLMFSVSIVHLYYFIRLVNQPIWWDEGDYLAIAKEISFARERPEWWVNFTGLRPLFLPLFWSIFFKLGFGEVFLRFFTKLIPGLLSIFFTYRLGKSMYNEKIGLIAAAMMSFNWVFMFYTFRLLTDIPSLFFSVLCLNFFWIGYETKNKKYYLWLAVAFGMFSFLTRYMCFLTLFSVAIYLIVTRQFSLIRDKNIWLAFILGILILSPIFYYYYTTQGNIFPAFASYHGSQSTAVDRSLGWDTVTSVFPMFITWPLVPFFVLGFILTMKMILYLDIIIKDKTKLEKNSLLVFLLLSITFVYLIFGIKVADARYYVFLSPAIFISTALGMNYTFEKISSLFKIKRYMILIAAVFCIILIVYQLKSANAFITSREDSYAPIREVGLWLKENSPPESRVVTASVLQNQYYSERQSFDMFTNDSLGIYCLDHNLELNESCTKYTETAFNKKVKQIKPNYFIISIFEPAFTPSWAYTYPQKYNLTFIKAFGLYNNQPSLILYKF